MLDNLKKNYDLFLISDGNPTLQTEKFRSLGLEKWIDPCNLGLTGLYGNEFAKPSTEIIKRISVLQGCNLPKSVVFFGDRDVDRQFAFNAGFQYIRAQGLIPEQSENEKT